MLGICAYFPEHLFVNTFGEIKNSWVTSTISPSHAQDKNYDAVLLRQMLFEALRVLEANLICEVPAGKIYP